MVALIVAPKPIVIAIREGHFEVHYQPLLDLTSRKVVAFEALMRWQRNGKLVPPALRCVCASSSNLMISA